MGIAPRSGLSGWLRSRSGLVFLGFLAIAAFFLWSEHRAHLLGILPFALLLVCPLLHLFHGGHRHPRSYWSTLRAAGQCGGARIA